MNEASPCQIRIDKEGVWYYGENEIFRKEIVLLFYENLTQDQSGRYLIVLGNERCYVEVEDAPFVVKSVDRKIPESKNRELICLHLSDESREPLDPDTLWVGRENVLYCSIRNASLTARFSRAAYYQIANYIEYDTAKDAYFIPLNGQFYYIK
jgi:uncharacterized protein